MRGLTARTRNQPSLGGERERLSPGYAPPTKPSEPSCDIAMSAAPSLSAISEGPALGSSSGVRPRLDRAVPASPAL